MSLHKHKFVSWELDSPRDSVTMNVLMGVQGSGKAGAEGESQSQNVGAKCTPHLYGPVWQLLGVSVALLKRENRQGTRHGVPCGFTCVSTERT